MKLSVGFGWVLLWLKSGFKWNIRLVQAESSCCTTLTSICPEEKGGLYIIKKTQMNSWPTRGVSPLHKCACFVQPQLPAVMTCITAHPPLWQNSPGPGAPCIPPVLVLPVPNRTVLSPQGGRAWILVRNNTASFPAPCILHFYTNEFLVKVISQPRHVPAQITHCPLPAPDLWHLDSGSKARYTALGAFVHTPPPPSSPAFLSVFNRESFGLAFFMDKQLTPKFIL